MTDWIASVVRTRTLVASLGESAAPPWWRSEATSPASRRMLERLYPRTYLVASIETASRAAAREHDARIGRIGTYHLFRLPMADEHAIHIWLHHSEGTALLQTLGALETADQQLAALSELASDTPLPTAQGPLRSGSVASVHSASAMQQICAAYLSGFRRHTHVFPYLDAAREAQA